MLKVQADNQHSDVIVNGISRIGYMTRGRSAGLGPAFGVVDAGAVTLYGNGNLAEGFPPQSRLQAGAPPTPSARRYIC